MHITWNSKGLWFTPLTFSHWQNMNYTNSASWLQYMHYSAMSKLIQLIHYTRNKPLVQVEMNQEFINCSLVTDSYIEVTPDSRSLTSLLIHESTDSNLRADQSRRNKITRFNLDIGVFLIIINFVLEAMFKISKIVIMQSANMFFRFIWLTTIRSLQPNSTQKRSINVGLEWIQWSKNVYLEWTKL